MAFDVSQILKIVPESTVSNFIDGIVDSELTKVGVELKMLVKEALDKAYGTTLSSQPVLSTSAQASPL